jgi:hypothetical protein
MIFYECYCIWQDNVFFFFFFFQEKYGPKGQGKASNGPTAKSNKDSKQQTDIDINVGLSERPPWFCRCVYIFFYLIILIYEHDYLIIKSDRGPYSNEMYNF